MAKAKQGKYLVAIGIHTGTITSRDSAILGEYDSPAEARREAAKAKAGYTRLGCKIWYINMYDDQGKLTVLDHGMPYLR